MPNYFSDVQYLYELSTKHSGLSTISFNGARGAYITLPIPGLEESAHA
ncbi:MAG: hypothetical protein KF716_30130 [Anaerolineae bacterium]|nr:hypothetical protein [Anaerolineae bacterium]